MSNRKFRQSGKAGGRKNENNRIYTHPLPLVIEPRDSSKWTPSFLGLFGLRTTRIEKPLCECVLDPSTRSVWVLDKDSSMLLWRRGFFGKGDLSRSEPSWLARQKKINFSGLTAEEVTAKRREERKQFKEDRAQALARAAQEAEAVFASRGVVLDESSVAIPSAATWKPSEGKVTGENASGSSDLSPQDNPEIFEPNDDQEDFEHLQLTLQETFFLLWTMDCLALLDPHESNLLHVSQAWRIFQNIYNPSLAFSFSVLQTTQPSRFDNPFLINYVIYHHYRSLGWVIRGGIKFCVDYLLYKRGPVFHHAEFALVVCPVYEDPRDRETSPFELQNVDPFPWSWLSTINRVNSQVMKTLVLVYVVIPSLTKHPSELLQTPACLQYYTIREVVVRRFVPARMRD